MELTWDNKGYYLSELPHRSQVIFALFCAKQVGYLTTGISEAERCIAIVERWLEGKATAVECGIAADADAVVTTNAAYAAANAASSAANVIYTNAHAAYAINAATYAAYAATYAANAAATYAASAAAVYAADAAVDAEDMKQEQIKYLRILYLDNLPKEEKNCWLVNACI